MKFSKYQWISEQSNTDNCGFCDIINIDNKDIAGENNRSFQVELDYSNLINLLINPFNHFTDATASFKFSRAIALANWSNFEFYFGGKIFIITYNDTMPFGVHINGNVYTFNMVINIITNTIGDIFDNYITPITGVTMTKTHLGSGVWRYDLANIPINSYVHDWNSLLYDLVNISDGILNNSRGFYYANKMLVQYEKTVWLRFSKAMVSGDNNYFDIKTVTYNNFDIKFTYTSPLLGDVLGCAGSGMFHKLQKNVVENIYVMDTDTYDVVIDFDNKENVSKGLIISAFEFNTITEKIGAVVVEDCNGVEHITQDDGWSDTPCDVYYKNTYYKNSLGEFPYGEVRIIVKNLEAGKPDLVSRVYNVIDVTDACATENLIKIEWWSNSVFNNLYYNKTNQKNVIYVTGVLTKASLDVINNTTNVMYNGIKKVVYKSTIVLHELKLHPFLHYTFENILERIFEHPKIKINDIIYTCSDVLKVSEIGNFIYTGTVDLMLDSSNVVTSNRCS